MLLQCAGLQRLAESRHRRFGLSFVPRARAGAIVRVGRASGGQIWSRSGEGDKLCAGRRMDALVVMSRYAS